MRRRSLALLSCVFAYLVCAPAVSAEQSSGEFPELVGPYFGQDVPGETAEIFAPGLVSINGRYEFAPSFSPDGRELLFSAMVPGGRTAVFHSRVESGRWTEPEAVSLSQGAKKEEMEAFFAPDGKHVFFAPYDEGMDVRIWAVEVAADGWTNPRQLGPPVSDKPAFFPTASLRGSLYYTNLAEMRIFRAELEDGSVKRAEDAGIELGGHPFVAPDESFLVLDGLASDAAGERDIFVVFRDDDGSWTKPRSLGSQVNTEYSETCPSLSSDGMYLFFSRYDEENELSNIYWIRSSVIDQDRGAARGE